MDKQITDSTGSFELYNGIKMPYLGLGTYQSDNDGEVVAAVEIALKNGYRHIDTASVYKNEQGVGKGIKNSGLAREDLFLVSKVWNTDQGYEPTLRLLGRALSAWERIIWTSTLYIGR